MSNDNQADVSQPVEQVETVHYTECVKVESDTDNEVAYQEPTQEAQEGITDEESTIEGNDNTEEVGEFLTEREKKYVLRHQGMNRQMRRSKNGTEQYATLKQNQMARSMREFEKSTGKIPGKAVTWGEVNQLYHQYKSAYAPILALVRMVRDPELSPFIAPEDARALTDNLTILNKDIPISLQELEHIHEYHKEHRDNEAIKFEDLEMQLFLIEKYQNYGSGFQGLIVPLFEHVGDIVRKAELRRTIYQNRDKVNALLNADSEDNNTQPIHEGAV